MQTLPTPILTALLLLNCSIVYADPWFTGPLLASPAQTVPRGGVTVFFETGHASSDSLYNNEWQRIAQLSYKTTQISPQFMYGLTDHLDIEYNALYEINQSRKASYEHIGDSSITLGFQALSQKNNPSHPDLRITITEVLPSGLFERFSPMNSGAEATGMGSYQSTLGFNFQYLSQLNAKHDLNSHLSITYTYANATNINGVSTYGGSSQTKGTINPGNAITIDLAGEFTLTQQWVAVMEANFIYQQASRFKGIVGVRSATDPILITKTNATSMSHRLFPNKHNIGSRGIGSGNLDQISLAPALEYNLSHNFGVISGVWFTVTGKNTPQFIAPIIQFTASW